MSTAAVPAQIFREYDIRGLVASEIRPDVAATIARAFAAYLRARGVDGPASSTLPASISASTAE